MMNTDRFCEDVEHRTFCGQRPHCDVSLPCNGRICSQLRSDDLVNLRFATLKKMLRYGYRDPCNIEVTNKISAVVEQVKFEGEKAALISGRAVCKFEY